MRLTGFALVLSLLLGLFALLVIGLPPELTRRITAEVQAAGIPLQVESIRLSTHRGWVFNNARLYSTSPDDLQPLLNAKKLYVSFRPVDWKNLSDGGWRIKIFVRDLGISLGRPWETVLPESHPFRSISKLTATLTAAPGRVDIEKADLRWGNTVIAVHGSAVFPAPSETEKPADTVDIRRRTAKAADAISRLKCDKPLNLAIGFRFNDRQPQENFLNAELQAEGLTFRDRVYKQFYGSAGYSNSVWTVSELRLNRTDREQLVLRGSFDTCTSNAQVSAENTLSASDLFNLLPDEAQSAVAQTEIKPYGRFDFTASAGPARYDLLAEKAEVHVKTAQLKRQDITLDPLAFRLMRNGSRVEMTDLKANANGGPLTGNFELNLESKAWVAHVQAQCNPGPAGTLAGDEDLKEFISRFKFPNELPKADLTIAQSAPGANLFVAGKLSGERFTCAGVPIEHIETTMVYSNEVLNLLPLHIIRGNEQFDGHVQVDFVRGLGGFNATNSFPPADIARVLAPDEHTILEEFRFNGPVYAAGSGQLDYRHWTNHSFAGIFRAEHIGFGKIEGSSFSSAVSGSGTRLIFTNTSMRLYGGQAGGSAEFDILLEDGSAPYRIQAAVAGLGLDQLLAQITTNDYNRTSGQLSASFDFSADAKSEFWKSVKGGGRVDIRDGRLADIPLFGGFSRLTQTVFPAFNLFSLTAFSADYELHDRAIWSENAQLGGTLVSARGRGSYSPERGLDFTVAAEPMRQTDDKERSQLRRLAATALKEGTAPLLRLLEFKLEGPLDRPEWHFVNLPKEVSGLPKEVSDFLLRKDK